MRFIETLSFALKYGCKKFFFRSFGLGQVLECYIELLHRAKKGA